MTNVIKKVLLVDDEQRLVNSMAQRLTLLGFETIKASSGTEAIELAKKNPVDLAIVDLKMPDMDGLTTTTKLKEIIPGLETVLLTGYGSEKIKQATEAIGSTYFEKDSMGDLWDLIKRLNTQGNVVVIKPASSASTPRAGNDNLKEGFLPNQVEILSDHYTGHRIDQNTLNDNVDSIGRSFGDLPKIIGETSEMQLLRKSIERLSELDCTIVIQGEAGTGKELAARAIHALSHRKGQRFIAFNCGCFSNDFHFNELLGSIEESASPGSSKKPGAFRKRFAGTVLLDHFEIIPEQTQLEMLKIINNKAVDSLVDIRFIVATHQDLEKRVKHGKFNRDLYHKLNAIKILMPSIAERREDISQLCSYFLSKFNMEFKKNIECISDEVLSIFMSYPFPGNVRELKHIIERAVILAESKMIEPQHLPDRLRKNTLIPHSFENQQFPTLNKMEQNHILKALETTQGNKSKAAEILGISRAALWRKLKLINAEK